MGYLKRAKSFLNLRETLNRLYLRIISARGKVRIGREKRTGGGKTSYYNLRHFVLSTMNGASRYDLLWASWA
jgi:hypothetical protein